MSRLSPSIVALILFLVLLLFCILFNGFKVREGVANQTSDAAYEIAAKASSGNATKSAAEAKLSAAEAVTYYKNALLSYENAEKRADQDSAQKASALKAKTASDAAKTASASATKGSTDAAAAAAAAEKASNNAALATSTNAAKKTAADEAEKQAKLALEAAAVAKKGSQDAGYAAADAAKASVENDKFECNSINGTQFSVFGCCSNGDPMLDSKGTNCTSGSFINSALTLTASTYPPSNPQSCSVSVFGCCPDGKTNRKGSSDDGCPSLTASSSSNMYAGVMPQNTNTVFVPPPVGINSQPAVVPPEPKPVEKKEPTNKCGCPKPRPCPPCGRCPEPAFECKKVPSYSDNQKFLPQAVLTDFSSFGM
jgi:hypothetical protein